VRGRGCVERERIAVERLEARYAESSATEWASVNKGKGEQGSVL